MLIPLTQGKFAEIDDEDAELVIGRKFHAVRIGSLWYARSKREYLHHLIFGQPRPGNHVDHRDHDGLNNRRSNLREVPHGINLLNGRKHSNNKSGYKGVSYCKQTGRWRANIQSQGKCRNLGRYDTPELAKAAYDAAWHELMENHI